MGKIIKLLKAKYFYIDLKLFIPVLALIFIGLLAIMDVSAPKAMETFSDRFYFVKQQSLWMVIGILGYLIASQINVLLWKKYATLLFLLTLISLILVIIPQIGTKILGARRWLDLGIVGFQPSELAKLTLCVYLAKLTDLKKNIIAYLIPIAITIGLVMFQPDLGTSVVLIVIAFTQIFISGIDLRKMFLVVACGIAIVTIFIFTSDYRKERVTSFMDPFSTEISSNYHIKQVLYSLALGGVSGAGIGQSKQKYLFLPEATTDSIFAIISEEVGFIGVVLIILLYLFVSVRMLISIKNIYDPFLRSLTIGIFAWFTGQVFVNLGSISSLIPFTGVPLPFISYGGSTLVSIMLAFGIFNSAIKYSK